MHVAAVVVELGRSSQGLVSVARLRAAGVSRQALSAAVSTGDVTRVRRRVYALGPLPVLPRHVVTGDGVAPAYVAQVRAELLRLGSRAAAGGRTAAALYGWGLLVEPRLVEVVVPHGWHVRCKGIRARQRRSAARSLVRVLEGTTRLRITTACQTVLDCARELPLVEAVVVCDSALRAKAVTLEQLVRAAARLPGAEGAARVRRVLALSDPDSGSVLESVLRVRMSLAGIEGFVSQAVLAVRPRTVRVDFCFPSAGLVIEVDGARWHQEPTRDQARDNLLAVFGWRVLRLTWAQVVHDHGQVLDDLRAALSATPSIHLAASAVDLAA